MTAATGIRSLGSARRRLKRLLSRGPGRGGEAGAPAASGAGPPHVSDVGIGLCLDDVLALDATSVFLRGWLWDPDGSAQDLVISTPSSEVSFPVDRLLRISRRDVDEHFTRESPERNRYHGFFAFVELPEPLRAGERCRLACRVGDGVLDAVELPPAVRVRCKEALFRLIPTGARAPASFYEEHLLPALSRLDRARGRAGAAHRTIGPDGSGSSPSVTVVVPVSDTDEVSEAQLAAFADAGLADAEFLYVLRAPDLAAKLEARLFELSRFYGIPLPAVVSDRPSSLQEAGAEGASRSRSSTVVLLHPDVLPLGGGWLKDLVALYEASGAAILSPKLLYWDLSIQHAGFDFRRDRAAGRPWSPVSRYKGLPRNHSPAQVAQSLPAVCDACVVLNRGLFEGVGGPDGVYAFGLSGFLDFCLRCRDAGHEIRYGPDLEMFHFELPGHGDGDAFNRESIERSYDRWLLDHRWSRRLAGFEADPREGPDPGLGRGWRDAR